MKKLQRMNYIIGVNHAVKLNLRKKKSVSVYKHVNMNKKKKAQEY